LAGAPGGAGHSDQETRVRPIRFDRDNVEAVLLDQVARDGRPRAIEF